MLTMQAALLLCRGDPEAHRQLGYRMLTGNGLPRDLAGAHREFNLAARHSHTFVDPALCYAAVVWASGPVVPAAQRPLGGTSGLSAGVQFDPPSPRC